MKSVTITIVGFALLLGLSGCLYPGGGRVSASYVADCPYPYSCYGAYYFGYPWFYPWGVFSFRYNDYYPYRVHNHRHPPHDSHRRNMGKKHDGSRPPAPILRPNKDAPRGGPQWRNARPRQRGRD